MQHNAFISINSEIFHFLANKNSLKAYLSTKEIYKDADFVVIATPTNFDLNINCFDTSSIQNVIDLVRETNKIAVIVIKSTVPLGYTEYLIKKYSFYKILFSPEFLREGEALGDNLSPSRIIIGHNSKNTKEAKIFGNILKSESLNNAPLVLMGSEEAEAVKLFSNAYLAMRVSFFNEVDTYAEIRGIDTKKIVEGISLDPRIGNFYNNPSFGYGGYCLPKDTAQLANSFLDIPNNNLIKAIVQSNITRKVYLAERIISNAISVSGKPKENITIGIYLLSMKTNSDNFRFSSTLDIVSLINEKGVKTIIYDPKYSESEKQFEIFIKTCDYYISNRPDKRLKVISPKLLYTRDIFGRD